MQNKAVQREAGGTSKLAAQYNSGLRVTGPVFPEIIPREDTEYRGKESDQRVSHGVRAEANFEKVLKKIDAAIEGSGSSPFQREMERVQYTDRIIFALYQGPKTCHIIT